VIRYTKDIKDAHRLRLGLRLWKVLVEHRLEVVKCADWKIDLGPKGSETGGYLVTERTPENVATYPESITGRMLKKLL
jgi:excinuclease ABC subunit A